MFNQTVEDRLSAWAQHRSELVHFDKTEVMNRVWEFWKQAPFVPYNPKIDPYYQFKWPTPWEIIVDNKYDDFTKSLMIGWTLKLTRQFQESKIEIKTLVDKANSRHYNIVCVDDLWAINYNDNGPVSIEEIRDTFLLENLVKLSVPR